MTCLGTCRAAPAAGPAPRHRADSALSRRRCAGPRGESAVFLSALSSFISLTIKQKAGEDHTVMLLNEKEQVMGGGVCKNIYKSPYILRRHEKSL